MTEQNKPRKRRAKKSEAPKVEAPKAEAKDLADLAETMKAKLEESEEKPVNIHQPVEVKEPKRMKLDPVPERPPLKHKDEPQWVDADYGITQSLYGMGRLKHRMRTRKSRYDK